METELEKDLKKEIIKKSGSIFGSSLKRFIEEKNEETPGPGNF